MPEVALAQPLQPAHQRRQELQLEPLEGARLAHRLQPQSFQATFKK